MHDSGERMRERGNVPSGRESVNRPGPAAGDAAAGASRPRAVVAVDTGGTFTDLVASIDGTLRTLKLPSTPDDPARAVLDGIAALWRRHGGARPYRLLHGSTVATNALLERTGARVVLLTNDGFTDVLEIGRQNRPQLYALVGRRPPPLVPRDRRWGLAGRRGPRGEALAPMDPAELTGLARRLRDAGAEAVAVCLLHSYADPADEEAVVAALEEAGLTGEIPVSASARLLPEYREYERTSTTVVNAYVAPVMAGYLDRLARESSADRVAVMGSAGGTLPVERAAREAAHTVLSGPAGGVVGALAWARKAGFDRIATFDMGGTSTDVSLCPGGVQHTREFEIGGHPVALPMLDIHTVGAGGGSLARVDAGGALRVGPESAGAVPGPVCYGRGGTGLTVTDAHVWLGRLPTDAFFESEGGLDREAVAPCMKALAAALGTTPDAAAEGILEVADTAMERALRVISVERGHDPATLSLVAFGGAGALHAAELTARLSMPRALIPPEPGLLSAWGVLTAPVTREASRTLLAATDADGTAARVAEALDALAREALAALTAEGVPPGEVAVARHVDARYRGQSFEIRVPGEGDWVDAFHDAHRQRYGYRRDAAAVEAVTCRAVATGPGLTPPEVKPGAAADAGPEGSGPVVYRGRTVRATRWRRGALRAGAVLPGPALVLDASATAWIPPGWTGRIDAHGILVLAPS
jgi:N-methylhydantoinase A